MRSLPLVEFTGERVIPGLVNDDLWSEHFARYAFARNFAKGKRVLDAGCGTGYGSAELAQTATEVTGIDIAAEAIEYANANYPLTNLRFIESSCLAVPFPAEAFDLVVAFEVIEHLTEYRNFLDECARVLTRKGVLIVSSPNKRYYAETRAATGPNPYHTHEFEAAEFVKELERVFPNVRFLLQNRVESFAFHPQATFWPAEGRIDGGGGEAEDAHFFLAVCSRGALPKPKSFVYVPKAANLLRERERHVEALEQQLADVKANRQALLDMFRKQTGELEERSRWAQKLDGDLQAAGERVMALQNELAEMAAGYATQLANMEKEDQTKTEWARRTSAELEAKCKELAECVSLLDVAEATLRERTIWAQTAEMARMQLEAQLEMVRSSRWVKISRSVGLGPKI
jgi:2-polyprenyl-3-methyl-5-hydroxy-6-metoxy-1,4-benzoquinol methylase